MTVADLKPKEKGILNAYSSSRIAAKFSLLGILPGSEIQVIRIAPFGGGYYIKVDGHNFALRKSEAEALFLAQND